MGKELEPTHHGGSPIRRTVGETFARELMLLCGLTESCANAVCCLSSSAQSDENTFRGSKDTGEACLEPFSEIHDGVSDGDRLVTAEDEEDLA